MLHDLLALHGVRVIHAEPLPSLANASIVAVAASNRCDALASFDKKLSKHSKDLGVATYW